MTYMVTYVTCQQKLDRLLGEKFRPVWNCEKAQKWLEIEVFREKARFRQKY
jgi:hypothetical protein